MFAFFEIHWSRGIQNATFLLMLHLLTVDGMEIRENSQTFELKYQICHKSYLLEIYRFKSPYVLDGITKSFLNRKRKEIPCAD